MTSDANLSLNLERAAARWPDAPAIIESDQPIGYSELWRRVIDLADELARLPIAPGERIGLLAPNGSLYIALTYALWRCGATVVPVAPELKAPEVEAIRKSIGVSGLITAGAKGDPENRESNPNATLGWSFVRFETEASCIPEGLDLAFIRFTSGTTGRHKGVALSHATIAERIAAANLALAVGPGDRILWVLPMTYHFIVTIVLYITHGATIIIPASTLAGTLSRTADRWKPTLLYGGPAHYQTLAGTQTGGGLAEVRLALSTAMGLSNETHEAFRRATGIAIAQAYGIIELGLVCINAVGAVEAPESVGLPVPGFELRVENLDREIPGGIKVRGPGFFDAYCDPWTPRDSICEDGWFATGDLGRFDQAGRLFLVGRTKEVIISAGMKIFPLEVEAVLNSHPAVAESRVFGKKHPRLGQIVEAEVVPRDASHAPDPNDVLRHAWASLALYKLPMRIHVVDKIGKTASGKIIRDEPN